MEGYCKETVLVVVYNMDLLTVNQLWQLRSLQEFNQKHGYAEFAPDMIAMTHYGNMVNIFYHGTTTFNTA